MRITISKNCNNVNFMKLDHGSTTIRDIFNKNSSWRLAHKFIGAAEDLLSDVDEEAADYLRKLRVEM